MLISDIHFQTRNTNDLIQVFDWVYQEVLHKKPRRMFFLGDFFDNRTSIKTVDLHESNKILRRFQNCDWELDIHFLVGK